VTVSPQTPSLDTLAGELAAAERSRRPVAPLTDRVPGLSVGDAYAIQRRNVARHVAAGARVVGRKIGLTSAPMQRMLGVDEPDFGVLLDTMRVADGDAVAVDELVQPKAEAEIAFVMARGLDGPGVDALAAAQAVAGVVPAIEIIDSRVADWRIKLPDTVADNASSGRFVLGAQLTPLAGVDLRLAGVVLTVGGVVAETGAGAAALGDPLRCVAWLANKLGEFGEGLRAGDVVLSGALHAAVAVEPGQTVRAEFAGLGSVSVHFGTGGTAA
jgi:2-oxopent-4-enoate hydratase